MTYVESPSFDPYFNIAMEQHLFETIGKDEDIFFLWRNENAIIIGKNQNAETEINKYFVGENGVKVVRRLSGGGAVYHDLGNVNFTFITNHEKHELHEKNQSLDMRGFCEKIASFLRSLGADARFGGRNDVTISGRKVSGGAQYVRDGRVMHHGTVLFDSNLDNVGCALKPPAGKLESKGVASVRSRVTNVSEHISEKFGIIEFMDKLKHFILGDDYTEYKLTETDNEVITKLKDEKYSVWEWNFGKSPRFSLRKSRFVPGCGTVEIYYEANNGVIQAVEFFGDYFGSLDTSELAALLVGCRLEEGAVRQALAGVDVGLYFHNITTDGFIKILLS